MSGGASAKNGYRYQDWCAMYFTLDEFKKDQAFERVYCEQGKLDFEIWSTTRFAGFQVKTRPSDLTAKETNRVFSFYLAKSKTSGKEEGLFRFVFSERPTKSLDHLFTFIRSGRRGVRYGGQVGKFITTALSNIPIGPFSIDFVPITQEDVERIVFAIAADILKSRLGTKDLPTEAIRSFVAKLRDEIDKISCNGREEDRVYSVGRISELIDNFLATVKLSKLESDGQRTVEIKLPEELQERIVKAMIDKPIPPRREGGAVDGQSVDTI